MRVPAGPVGPVAETDASRMDELCKRVGQWQHLRRVTINDFRKPDFVATANRWSVACMKFLTKPPKGNAFVAETVRHLLSDIPARFKSASGDLTYALKDMFEAFPILKNVSFYGT